MMDSTDANDPLYGALGRLQSLVDDDASPLAAATLGTPAPEAAITNLERWLHATGNPRLYLDQMLGLPQRAKQLLFLFGSGQAIADTFIQNPGFSSLILDSGESGELTSPEEIFREGSLLLQTATSPSHQLDRLRYLKQRYNLAIVVADLIYEQPQPAVWKALSNLADVLIQLTLNAQWRTFAVEKALPEEPPVAIVGFGKLGGRELNYSSDVDLAYVAQDGLDERTERESGRFLQHFGRALSDRMGRGSVYRVDLRLRPYGAAGSLLNSMSAVESYYKLYAEPWEVQALLRSRVIVGDWLRDRWASLVEKRCFQAHVTEASIQDLLQMRRRIEEHSTENDLKRGAGGIRDVEFVVQILQLLHGFEHRSVRVPTTLDALTALADEHLLEPSVVTALLQSYTLLRKLEHRIQLIGDQQTHSIPQDEETRRRLAILMGLSDWSQLERQINLHRRSVHSLYKSLLKEEPIPSTDRQAAGDLLGSEAPGLWQWFDVWPEPEQFYRSLLENRDSLRRVKDVLDHAPLLVSKFKASLQMTEQLLSGEIEELGTDVERLQRIPPNASVQVVAETYINARTVLAPQFLFDKTRLVERDLTSVTDALVALCARCCGVQFDILALGSYGVKEMGFASDLDLLLLTRDDQMNAERAAQEFLNLFSQLRRFGLDLSIDLRLRPEGKKGLLVRTYDGFGAYDVGDMEMWERFALGQSRLILGNSDALDLVRRAAYVEPLTAKRLDELMVMKGRIEKERLKPQYMSRDIKLGHGGLSDIEWTVHLLEMRHSPLVESDTQEGLDNRIQHLGRLGVLNAFEVEELRLAHAHLLKLRSWLYLQQAPGDLVPENPAKLDRLARAMGQSSANDFLRQHEPVMAWVRAFFLETVERLKK